MRARWPVTLNAQDVAGWGSDDLLNGGIGDLRGLTWDQLDLVERREVLPRTEPWERGIARRIDGPAYPSLVRNVHGAGADGRFYLFYSIHDPTSGIAVALADTVNGPFVKLGDLERQRVDSRILRAPLRPLGTSHFASPQVVWNPESRLWTMFFHFYRNEVDSGHGHQKTAVALSENLINWQIVTDDKGRYRVAMPVHPGWMNSQSTYHAIGRLPGGPWIAFLRGTSGAYSADGAWRNSALALAIAVSDDGLDWAVVPDMPLHVSEPSEKSLHVIRPHGIAVTGRADLELIWSERGGGRPYAARVHRPGKPGPDLRMPDGFWDLSAGPVSIRREDDRVHRFANNWVDIFRIKR